MDIQASSLWRGAGSLVDRVDLTRVLLTQLRRNIYGAVQGDSEARKRLEAMLLSAQQFAFQNPGVSCSYSYSIARSFANAGDTPGYVLSIEGPWYNGIDFEFIRRAFGLYGGVFDYLQEYGLPERLKSPFHLVRVDEVEPWTPRRVFP